MGSIKLDNCCCLHYLYKRFVVVVDLVLQTLTIELLMLKKIRKKIKIKAISCTSLKLKCQVDDSDCLTLLCIKTCDGGEQNTMSSELDSYFKKFHFGAETVLSSYFTLITRCRGHYSDLCHAYVITHQPLESLIQMSSCKAKVTHKSVTDRMTVKLIIDHADMLLVLLNNI